MDIVYLVILGLGIVVVTRYILCEGIERLAEAIKLSPKTKGQILGYSTSMPELVGTVSTAALGLLGAGLWNVAASNIINLGLFITANVYYKQQRVLTQRKFLDETSFAVGSILIPLVLVFGGGWDRSIWTAVGLLVFFVIYLFLDWRLNREVPSGDPAQISPVALPGERLAAEEKEENESSRADSSIKGGEGGHGDHEVGPSKGLQVALALGMILAGLGAVVLLGRFLGTTAENVVKNIGIPQVGVGWIMGVVTSLPELTSFFSIYGTAKKKGKLGTQGDTQEALDNLAASNMSNLGLIYPIGILIFIAAGYS